MGFIMRFYKYILPLVAVLLLSACGGGDSGDDYDYYDETYIYWEGSVNGTIVVDATDDAFEFEINTGYLHFGSTTYTNTWVDDGDFFVDGELIGAVYYIKSFDNETITALISNNGYYIDIYGPESDLAWEETSILPIYAFKSASTSENKFEQSIYSQTAQETKTKPSIQAKSPVKDLNAFTQDLPENNQSSLSKKF